MDNWHRCIIVQNHSEYADWVTHTNMLMTDTPHGQDPDGRCCREGRRRCRKVDPFKAMEYITGEEGKEGISCESSRDFLQVLIAPIDTVRSDSTISHRFFPLTSSSRN